MFRRIVIRCVVGVGLLAATNVGYARGPVITTPDGSVTDVQGLPLAEAQNAEQWDSCGAAVDAPMVDDPCAFIESLDVMCSMEWSRLRATVESDLPWCTRLRLVADDAFYRDARVRWNGRARAAWWNPMPGEHEVCIAGCDICATAMCGCATDADCNHDDLCTTGECVGGECVFTDVECPEGEFCDPATGECVECLTDDDCPEGQICDLNTGECREPGCVLEYSEDFSPCPDWQTDQPENYFCDSGVFHATVENAWPCYSPSRYAYTLIDYDGNSMKLEFDIIPVTLEWSAAVAFGLFDENLMIFPDPDDPRDPHYIHATPGRADPGRTIGLYVRGANGVHQARNIRWNLISDGICYHCVLEYDSAGDAAALTVTRCDTGEFVDAVQITGIGGLPVDLDYLGFARDPCGNCCCDPGWCPGYSCSNEATADLDNVEFCEYIECLTDADCDDELYCNGEETCVDGVCVEGTNPCDEDETCDEEADECLALVPHSLYVADHGNNQLFRLDPQTGALLGDPIALSFSPQGLAAEGGELYAIDTSTNELVRIQVPAGDAAIVGQLNQPVTPGDLAFHDGILYAVTADQNLRHLVAIDYLTADVLWEKPITLDGYPLETTAAEGLASYNGHLLLGFRTNHGSQTKSNMLGTLQFNGDSAEILNVVNVYNVNDSADFDGLAVAPGGLVRSVDSEPGGGNSVALVSVTLDEPGYVPFPRNYGVAANDLAFVAGN